MGFFDAISDAFANPLQETLDGFTKVFTNPAKANFGNFVSVGLPFAGGTIVSDFKHPQDIATQAAILAAAGGAAGAYNAYQAAPLNAVEYADLGPPVGAAPGGFEVADLGPAVSSGSGTAGQLSGIGYGDSIMNGIGATTAGIGSAIKSFPTALLALPLVKSLLGGNTGAPAGSKGSDVSLGLNFANPSGDISNALGNLRNLFAGSGGNSRPSGAVTPQAQLAGPSLIIMLVVGGLAVTYFAPKLFGKKR